jgi:hypothetical protein
MLVGTQDSARCLTHLPALLMDIPQPGRRSQNRKGQTHLLWTVVPAEKDNFRTLQGLIEEFVTRDGTDYVEPIVGYGARVHLAQGVT